MSSDLTKKTPSDPALGLLKVSSQWILNSSPFKNLFPYQDCFPFQIAQLRFLLVSSSLGWGLGTRDSHGRGHGLSKVLSFSASFLWIQLNVADLYKEALVLTGHFAAMSTAVTSLSPLCLMSWHGMSPLLLTQPYLSSKFLFSTSPGDAVTCPKWSLALVCSAPNLRDGSLPYTVSVLSGILDFKSHLCTACPLSQTCKNIWLSSTHMQAMGTWNVFFQFYF